jgi:uncharacterized protein
VYRDSYASIFAGETLRTIVGASVAESIPGCADCAFLPYCGTDPIHHYATTGDLVPHIPTSEFHEKNFFIIHHLMRLYERDETARRVFSSWVREAA